MRGQRSFAAIAALLPCLLLRDFVLASSLSQKGCRPSACGLIQDIRYPFRLKGDPDGCGDLRYELTCDERNNTILDFLSQRFYVTSILYEKFTIQVSDVDLVNRSCSLPHRSLSPEKIANSGLYDGTYFPSTAAWVSFINCTEKINSSSSYLLIPCLCQNKSFVYLITGFRVGSLWPTCRFLYMTQLSLVTNTPATKTIEFRPDGTFLGADEQLLVEHIFELLSEGFSLTWLTSGDFSAFHVINSCLQYTLRQFKYIMKSEGILSALGALFSREVGFLHCIHYHRRFKHRTMTFVLAVASVMLMELFQILIALEILGRFVFAPLAVFAFLLYKFRNERVPVDAVEKFLQNQQDLAPTRYAYSDIIAITSNFREKVGQGGFGSVFKGSLPGGRLVAVKMLGKSKCNGDEFINEVSTIGRIHHVNVVNLIGFCPEGLERALVYEFMPNGSLDKYIFSPKDGNQNSFTLEKLNEIALGVARGIDYLHRGCDMQILHFDIKPHNILLGRNFTPKVSDFGLAKLYPRNYNLISVSAARGTIGYIAPELISRSFGIISYKADVYSFGMLLLEMAGRRRNVDPRAENSSRVYYPSWIYDRLNQKEVELQEDIKIDELEKKLGMVGLWCIQVRPSDRPCMSKVVEMLEADVDTLEMPPKPFFSEPQSTVTAQACMESSFTRELSIISELE